jgi:hypothetical protein
MKSSYLDEYFRIVNRIRNIVACLDFYAFCGFLEEGVMKSSLVIFELDDVLSINLLSKHESPSNFQKNHKKYYEFFDFKKINQILPDLKKI